MRYPDENSSIEELIAWYHSYKDSIFAQIIHNGDIPIFIFNYVVDHTNDRCILEYALKHKICTEDIAKKILSKKDNKQKLAVLIVKNSNFSLNFKKHVINNITNIDTDKEIINNLYELKDYSELIRIIYEKYKDEKNHNDIDILALISINQLTPMDILVELMSSQYKCIRDNVIDNEQFYDYGFKDGTYYRNIKDKLPEDASLIFGALRSKPWLKNKKIVTLDPGGARNKLKDDEVEDFYEQDKYIDAFRPNGIIISKLIKKYGEEELINNFSLLTEDEQNIYIDNNYDLINSKIINKESIPIDIYEHYVKTSIGTCSYKYYIEIDVILTHPNAIYLDNECLNVIPNYQKTRLLNYPNIDKSIKRHLVEILFEDNYQIDVYNLKLFNFLIDECNLPARMIICYNKNIFNNPEINESAKIKYAISLSAYKKRFTESDLDLFHFMNKHNLQMKHLSYVSPRIIETCSFEDLLIFAKISEEIFDDIMNSSRVTEGHFERIYDLSPITGKPMLGTKPKNVYVCDRFNPDLPEDIAMQLSEIGRQKLWLKNPKLVKQSPDVHQRQPLRDDEVEDFYEQDKFYLPTEGSIISKLIEKYAT
jgi:hypothetical protein